MIKRAPFRLSLKYKLAFPVVLSVSLMLLILFYTTFRLVNSLVMERAEDRLVAITDVFTEFLRDPVHKKEIALIDNRMNWIAQQENVSEVRIEDEMGSVIRSLNPSVVFPDWVSYRHFKGIRRIGSDQFAVASMISMNGEKVGRLIVLYTDVAIHAELKEIFQERLLIAFIMIVLLSFITSAVTWLGIRPLFTLEKVAKRVVTGDLDARAEINSYDEIQDVSDAFNEMMTRLGSSLERLRLRTEALEESEEKYRLIVEGASDIIFTMTKEGRILLINRGFSGYKREELRREGLALILSLHTEETREAFQNAFDQALDHKETVTNVPLTHQLRASDVELHYLANLAPIYAVEGSAKMVQVVMRDVTELKKIEMMKEALIRDVAHELKTPTAKFEMALTWFKKEMEEKKELQPYQGMVKIMDNNVERLMHTIMSIMDLSKIESGAIAIEKQSLDINIVLQQAVKDMKPFVEEKKLTIDVSTPKEELKVLGDSHMLYRVVTNLIQNAIKYSEMGAIKVSCQKESREVVIRVSDEGMGIEPEDLERIFDRFVQKTAASVGIGVGLTICKSIVSLHDGQIWAQSEGLGKGSTFVVRLPLFG